MKDTGRIKERHEFTFDSRQLGLVLFGTLAAALLVFVLGMSVGRQWERRLHRADEAGAPQPAQPAPEAVLPAAPPVEPAPPAAEPAAEVAEPAPEPAPVAQEQPAPAEIPPEDLTFPKALTSKTRPAPAPVKAKKAPAPRGAYTVQVGAFKDKKTADRLDARLRNKGYASGILVTDASGGGKVYRVHVGGFGSREEAQKLENTLRKKEGLNPYVTSY